MVSRKNWQISVEKWEGIVKALEEKDYEKAGKYKRMDCGFCEEYGCLVSSCKKCELFDKHCSGTASDNDKTYWRFKHAFEVENYGIALEQAYILLRAIKDCEPKDKEVIQPYSREIAQIGDVVEFIENHERNNKGDRVVVTGFMDYGDCFLWDINRGSYFRRVKLISRGEPPKSDKITLELTREELAILFCLTGMGSERTKNKYIKEYNIKFDDWDLFDKVSKLCQKLNIDAHMILSKTKPCPTCKGTGKAKD